jgi:hypothetical protein
MADHVGAGLVCDALAIAIELRHPTDGFIFHSDGQRPANTWPSDSRCRAATPVMGAGRPRNP